MPTGPRRVVVLLVALAAVALLVLLLNREQPGDTPSPVADEIAKPTPADHGGRPEPPAEFKVVPGPAPPPAGDSAGSQQANDQQGHDQDGAVQDFKKLNRYPASSRRLTGDSADLLNPNSRYERRQLLADGEANADMSWEVLLTADRYFVRGREPLEVSLALWHENREVVPRRVVMTASRLDVDNTVSLSLQRDGSGWSAQLFPAQHWPGYVGELRVEATFSATGLAQQTGSLVFYFTSPGQLPGEFTGEFSDRLSAGDLLVDVGMRVDQQGRYRVEANLFDVAGKPVAWASFEDELRTGLQGVPLKFYGLVFHDAGATGPFVLRQLRGYRLRRGGSPHRQDMADYPGEYYLAGHYEPTDFTTAEYSSPWKKRMLEFYKEALARGVKLGQAGARDE
ncbi:MAG: hypothetical protein ABGY28_07165 [bacterium]|nr:hypothetical protein [Candidatus Binatota bacterium]